MSAFTQLNRHDVAFLLVVFTLLVGVATVAIRTRPPADQRRRRGGYRRE